MPEPGNEISPEAGPRDGHRRRATIIMLAAVAVVALVTAVVAGGSGGDGRLELRTGQGVVPGITVAALAAIGHTAAPDGFVLSALTDLAGVGLHIELPDGSRMVPDRVQRHDDPARSGWTALAQFAQHVEIPPEVEQVHFVLVRADGVEVVRRAVDVPGR